MSLGSVFRDVMRDYEKTRASADRMLEQRRETAYEDIPGLLDMDKSLGLLGIGAVKLALAGDTKGLAEARAASDDIKKARRALLAGKGMDEDYLNAVDYNCAACADTGFVQSADSGGMARCACLKQRLIEEYYALSNVKEVLRDENFGTFEARFFSDRLNESEGLSPRANIENIKRLATRFVTSFEEPFQNLLLYGETGLGKTFVCHCIARELLDMGKTVLYLTAPRLCKVIEDHRFNREALKEPNGMLETVDEVDLLILDDLGAEISTVITSAALFDIINQRLLSRKPTVISTNLTPPVLESQYSERIVSRFLGNYHMIKFFGEDIRIKKKYGGLHV